MTTYISILRGINVSGHKLIKMDALRALYENMGLSNVTTYIQSGNVIFNGPPADTGFLEQKISGQIKSEFGFEVTILVLTMHQLKEVIENNPFIKAGNENGKSVQVTFLSVNPDLSNIRVIEDRKQESEGLFISENAVYLHCPNGYGKTKLENSFLESKLKVRATTRNWNTTKELYNIAALTAREI